MTLPPNHGQSADVEALPEYDTCDVVLSEEDRARYRAKCMTEADLEQLKKKALDYLGALGDKTLIDRLLEQGELICFDSMTDPTSISTETKKESETEDEPRLGTVGDFYFRMSANRNEDQQKYSLDAVLKMAAGMKNLRETLASVRHTRELPTYITGRSCREPGGMDDTHLIGFNPQLVAITHGLSIISTYNRVYNRNLSPEILSAYKYDPTDPVSQVGDRLHREDRLRDFNNRYQFGRKTPQWVLSKRARKRHRRGK